ncbi:MAG: DUF6702 family protein [Pseudomonadota bacterium]
MQRRFSGLLATVAIYIVGALPTEAHPLRLSLSEVEFISDQQLLTISLRLFLMDVNEALVFDPESTELAFCQPNESVHAVPMLLEYLDRFFYVKVNGEKIDLNIKSKQLNGEGINTALAVLFEHHQDQPIRALEVKNAVFTDLFFDQSNIVYVHIDGDSTSLMLNKKTPTHTLRF